MILCVFCSIYLRFINPSEWHGGETNLLRMCAFVPPITQQKVELTIIMEWLLFSLWQIHYQRTIQSCCSLHTKVSMIEVCTRLHHV